MKRAKGETRCVEQVFSTGMNYRTVAQRIFNHYYSMINTIRSMEAHAQEIFGEYKRTVELIPPPPIEEKYLCAIEEYRHNESFLGFARTEGLGNFVLGQLGELSAMCTFAWYICLQWYRKKERG